MPLYGAEDSSPRRFILRQVLSSISCSACGARYSDDDVTVIESDEGVWMLMALCPGCETQSMIVVVLQTLEEEREVLPDLDEDDVLDLCTLLKDFEGDIKQLLGRANS